MPLRASYEAPKSTDDLGYCIVGKLSWLAEPTTIDRGDRREIAFQYRGITWLLVELAPASERTTSVQVRGRVGLRGRVKRDLEACL